MKILQIVFNLMITLASPLNFVSSEYLLVPLYILVIIYRKRTSSFQNCESAFQVVRKTKFLDLGESLSPEASHEPNIDSIKILESKSVASSCLSEGTENSSVGKLSIVNKKLSKNRESASKCRRKKKIIVKKMMEDLAASKMQIESQTSMIENYSKFIEKLRHDTESMKRNATKLDQENHQLKDYLDFLYGTYEKAKEMTSDVYSKL